MSTFLEFIDEDAFEKIKRQPPLFGRRPEDEEPPPFPVSPPFPLPGYPPVPQWEDDSLPVEEWLPQPAEEPVWQPPQIPPPPTYSPLWGAPRPPMPAPAPAFIPPPILTEHGAPVPPAPMAPPPILVGSPPPSPVDAAAPFSPPVPQRVPTPYSQLVLDAEQRYQLPPGLLDRVITQESQYNPRAVSRAGAQGLMQLMPGTARDLGVQDPFDPMQNVDGGARFLKSMLDRYKGNVALGLAAYNAGPGNVDKYGGVPPFPETQAYLQKILGGAESAPPHVPPPPREPGRQTPPPLLGHNGPLEAPPLTTFGGLPPDLGDLRESPRRLPPPQFGPPMPTVRLREEDVERARTRAEAPSTQMLQMLGEAAEPLGAPDKAWRAALTTAFSPEVRTEITARLNDPRALPQRPFTATERAWEAWNPPPGVKGLIEMANPLYPGPDIPLQGAAGALRRLAPPVARAARAAGPPLARAVEPKVLPTLERLGAMRTFYANSPDDAARQFASLDDRYADLSDRLEDVGNRIAAEQMEAAAAREGLGVVRPRSGPLAGLTDEDLLDIALREERNPYQSDWYDSIDPVAVKDYRETIKGRTGASKRAKQQGAVARASILEEEYNALKAEQAALIREMEGLDAAARGEGPLANEAPPLAFTEQRPPTPKPQEQQGTLFAPGEARPQFGATAKPAGTADILGTPQFPDEAARLRWEREQAIARGQGEMLGEAALAQEPWQMTLQELNETGYIGYDVTEHQYVVRSGKAPDQAANASEHSRLVAKALSEGKPVPPEVLADYPDLAKATEPAPSFAADVAQWEQAKRKPPLPAEDIAEEAVSQSIEGAQNIEPEVPPLRVAARRPRVGRTQEAPPQFGAPPPPRPPSPPTPPAGGEPPRLPPPRPPVMEGDVIDTALAKPAPSVTPPVDDYQRLIESLTPEERSAWEKIKGSVDWTLREFYDRMYPLAGLQKKSGVPTHDLAQIVPGAQSAGEERIRLSALPALRPVAKDTKYLEQYMVSMRNKDLRARNPQAALPGGVEDPDRAIAGIKKQLGPKRFAAVEQAAQKLWDNQDTNVLRVLKDEGFLSEEAYTAIRKNNPHYIDFHRSDFSLSDAFEREFSRPEASVSGHFVNRISEAGSEKKLDQPLARSLAQYIQTAHLTGRNRAARSVHEALDAALPDTARVLKEGDTVPPSTEGVIAYFKDGQKVRIAVPKVYADVAKNLDAESANVLSSLLRGVSAPLRHGAVTYNPAFVLVNPIRDAISAFYREGLVPLSPEYIRGWVAAFAKNSDFTEAAESGVLMSGIVESMRSTDAVKRAATMGGFSVTNPKDLALAIPRAIERLNMASEQATRIATFHKLKGQGLDDLAAAVRARDVTVDFAKSGNVVKLINQAVPFLNAGVQGAANTLRLMRQNPKQALLASAPLVAGSVATFLWNQRFETAKLIPDYEYANNWIIQYGEAERQPDPKYPDQAPERIPLYVKVPKGPLGGLITAPAEMALRIAWKQDDRSAVEHILNALGTGASALSPVGLDASSLATPGAGTVMQIAGNVDLFRGGQIVPEREKNRPDELRYGPENSKVATALGEQLKVSPRLIDFAIRDFAAGAGTTSTWLADLALGALGYDPQVPGEAKRQGLSPEEGLAKLPVVSRFMGTRGTQEDRTGYDRFEQAVQEGQRTLMANPEMRRLGISSGPVAESVKRGGQDVPLEWEQRVRLQRDADALKSMAIDALIAQPYYQGADDKSKAEMASNVLGKMTAIAKNTVSEKPLPFEKLQQDAAQYPLAYGLYREYQEIPTKKGLTIEQDRAGREIKNRYDALKSALGGNMGKAKQALEKEFGADAMRRYYNYTNRGDNLERERFWKKNKKILDYWFKPAGQVAAAMQKAG